MSRHLEVDKALAIMLIRKKMWRVWTDQGLDREEVGCRDSLGVVGMESAPICSAAPSPSSAPFLPVWAR